MTYTAHGFWEQRPACRLLGAHLDETILMPAAAAHQAIRAQSVSDDPWICLPGWRSDTDDTTHLHGWFVDVYLRADLVEVIRERAVLDDEFAAYDQAAELLASRGYRCANNCSCIGRCRPSAEATV